MHYLRAIVIHGEEEYMCKVAATPKEAIKLIESGFRKADEIDGKHLDKRRR
jgi:hypothetical protein